MLPIRFSTLFQCRWMALLWAVAVVWLALAVVRPDSSAQPGDATGATISDDDLNKFADFAGRA
jgi:hypothetical protein